MRRQVVWLTDPEDGRQHAYARVAPASGGPGQSEAIPLPRGAPSGADEMSAAHLSAVAVDDTDQDDADAPGRVAGLGVNVAGL